MSQLALNINNDSNLEPESFLLSNCNKKAFDAIDGWPDSWSSNCLLIVGDRFSGKTHLSNIWQKKAGAEYTNYLNINELLKKSEVLDRNIIVENIDEIEEEFEENLFHIYNRAKEQNKYLLLTSSKPIYELKFNLPDLKSRISSSLIVNIEKPDEEFQKTLFQKQFLDKQISINEKVIDYIIPRIERSFEANSKIVDILNKKSIETKRNITIPFIKEILDI